MSDFSSCFLHILINTHLFLSAWKLYWMLCITSPWLPSSENKFPVPFTPMLDSGAAFFSTSLRSYSRKAFFSSDQLEVSSSEEDFVTIYDTPFLVFRVHILLFLLLSYIVYFLALLFTFKLALNFGIFLNIIIFFKYIVMRPKYLSNSDLLWTLFCAWRPRPAYWCLIPQRTCRG